MAVTGILSFLIISLLPSQYQANALIETGILNYKGIVIERESAFVQKFQIESSFNQLIEFMKSRSIVQRLSWRLLQHELYSDQPFRQPDKIKRPTTDTHKAQQPVALALQTDTTTWEATVQLNRLAQAYGYDYESLLKHMEIVRKGDTDYLELSFTFESPQLALFATKAYLEEFFQLYRQELVADERKSLEFWQKQVEEKKKLLEEKQAQIEAYRRSNNLVDITRQKENLLAHVRELELERERTAQKIPALEKAIQRLNQYILARNHVKGDAFARTIFLNEEVQALTDQIKKLNAEYLKDGRKNHQLAQQIAQLRQRQEKLIARLANLRQDGGPHSEDRVETLLKARIDKELELELAKAAVHSLHKEIERLRGQANLLVANDAELTRMEQERQVLEKEYLELMEKLKEAKLQSEHQEVPIRLLEPPTLPDKPKPKKRLLISVFAATASGGLMVLLILLAAFLDTTLYSPPVFVQRTELPLLVAVVDSQSPQLHLSQLFEAASLPNPLQLFRENIRALRHELIASKKQIVLFTSLRKGAGKSYLILCTAYALALQHKRVLIVDTNLRHNTLSTFQHSTHPNLQPQDIGIVLSPLPEAITIIGNKSMGRSPMEVFSETEFKQMLDHYRTQFDFIFLEGAALNDFPDSKELDPFVQRVVLICSARDTIEQQDQQSIFYLKSLDKKLLGAILNKVDMRNL